MSKRIFQQSTFTPTQQADQVLTGSWMCLNGGATNVILKIGKIILAGQAASSAINAMCLARTSALGVTPTALALPNSDGFANVNATAMTTVPVAYVAAATAPNRSPAVTIARLNLVFNAFGGIMTWQTNPGSEEEWTSIGSTVTSQSESVLSAYNVGAPGRRVLLRSSVSHHSPAQGEGWAPSPYLFGK
jgi:hypothetical protein